MKPLAASPYRNRNPEAHDQSTKQLIQLKVEREGGSKRETERESLVLYNCIYIYYTERDAECVRACVRACVGGCVGGCLCVCVLQVDKLLCIADACVFYG